MALRLSGALLALSTAIMGGPALAITLKCIPRDATFEHLREESGEVVAHRGVTAQGQLLEVLVSPQGTFTAFITFPDGMTCPIAAGDGWRDIPPPVAEDPET